MIGSAEDRLAIRELLDMFAAGVMRIDMALWGSTWAEDGRWKTPIDTEAAVGRTAILASFEQKMAYVKFMTLISFPAGLLFNGERARGHAFCQEIVVSKSGHQKLISGVYQDEYIKRRGRWYFLSRTYEVLGTQ